MAASGFVFLTLPRLAVVGFTCFAAYRTRRHKILKMPACTCLARTLVPLGVVARFASLWTRPRVPSTADTTRERQDPRP
ncbi:hypothetical protein ACFUN7_16515 [Streptomyces sp. NPDC057236]|uniref:hypothetical protein n=1 Tax=Streptomyces sp. NPDC057236 TaxID=3346059 RepID=UPI003625E56C